MLTLLLSRQGSRQGSTPVLEIAVGHAQKLYPTKCGSPRYNAAQRLTDKCMQVYDCIHEGMSQYEYGAPTTNTFCRPAASSSLTYSGSSTTISATCRNQKTSYQAYTNIAATQFPDILRPKWLILLVLQGLLTSSAVHLFGRAFNAIHVSNQFRRKCRSMMQVDLDNN